MKIKILVIFGLCIFGFYLSNTYGEDNEESINQNFIDSLYMDKLDTPLTELEGVTDKLSIYLQEKGIKKEDIMKVKENLSSKNLKYPFYSIFDEGLTYTINNNIDFSPAVIIEKGTWICDETQKIADKIGVKREDISAIINKETYGGTNIGKFNPFDVFRQQIAINNEWNQKKFDKEWRKLEYPSTENWSDDKIKSKTSWYWDSEGQLEALNEITKRLKLSPEKIKSSSAGAIGVIQVMPKSLLNVWNKLGENPNPFDIIESREITAFLIKSYGASKNSDIKSRWEAFRYYNAGYSKNSDGSLQGGEYANDVLYWAEIYGGRNQTSFGYPLVDSDNISISAGFHDKGYYQRFHLVHDGIDFAYSKSSYNEVKKNNSFSQVKATMKGIAIVSYMEDGWGNNVLICDNGENIGTCVLYAHLQKVSLLNLKTPNESQTNLANKNYGKYASKTQIIGVQEVNFGEIIGQMGTSGYSTKEHLHLQVNRSVLGGDYTPVNPLNFYAKIESTSFIKNITQN